MIRLETMDGDRIYVDWEDEQLIDDVIDDAHDAVKEFALNVQEGMD